MNTRDEDGRPAEVLLVEDTPGDVAAAESIASVTPA